MRVINLI